MNNFSHDIKESITEVKIHTIKILFEHVRVSFLFNTTLIGKFKAGRPEGSKLLGENVEILSLGRKLKQTTDK